MKLQGTNLPHLIVPMGIPGAGKSYFAEQFGKSFNAPVISFDNISKILFGEKAKTAKQKLATEKLANYLLNEVLKTGLTVIYDGPTEQRTNRTKVRKIARDFNYEPILVWVQTEQEVAQARHKKSAKISDQQYEALLKKFDKPILTEKTVVISGQHTFNSQLKIILRYLASQKPESASVNRNTPIGRR